MTEEVVTFGCSQSLVGILTNPPLTTLGKLSPGIIILGAGMVHRVGPNRLSVKISRVLGQLGFTTLRFDFSGIGDSFVRKDNLPYHKSVILEAQEAMNFVQSAKGIQHFILLGICTGSNHSIMVAREDPRVRGIFLINVVGGFDLGAKAELKDYAGKRKAIQLIWKDKIFNSRDWYRCLTGQISYKNLKNLLSFQAINSLFGQKRLRPNTERFFGTLDQLTQKGVTVQFALSGTDLQFKNYFDGLIKDRFSNGQFAGKVFSEVLVHPDQTFTSLSSQPQLFQVIQNFVLKYSGGETPKGQIGIKETPSKLVGI